MGIKYANTEIDFTVERLVELVQLGIDGLREDDEYEALHYFAETMELTDYERKFFGVPEEDDINEENDEKEYSMVDAENDDWENSWDFPELDPGDDCFAVSDDECTGHCMSCPYRPV